MQYRYFHEGQLKEDPTTGTRCRTGQLNHQFVEQKFVGGNWVGIGDNDGVRYGDVAGAGCRFREGMRDGDYVVDVEIEVAGFLLAEGDGWVNIGGASGYWMPRKQPLEFLADFRIYPGTYEIDDHIPNLMPDAVDYLTVIDATHGAESFQCPNTQDYIDADTDCIWFNHDASQRIVTTAELIGYDLQRTPVKYLDNVPNTIQEIVILKVGEVLTAGERDSLFRYMHLPILWDNSLNAYGYVKSNRIGQSIWVKYGPELVTNGGALGTTDWVDTNADGLADTWSGENGTAQQTNSIVTGNGFTGNAQRSLLIDPSGTNGIYKTIAGHQNKLVAYSITYRTNKAAIFDVIGININLPLNIGNAVTISGTLTTHVSVNFIEAYSGGNAIGDYFEVGKISIKEIY